MEHYEVIAKKAVSYQINIEEVTRQIEAISKTLLGAIALGKSVRCIDVNINDINKIDLTSYIEVFNEAKKSVEELEEFFYMKTKELRELKLKLCCENSQLKVLFKTNPDLFLQHFFIIDNKKSKELLDNGVLKKFQEKIITDNIFCRNVALNNEILIFFKNKDDFYKIQQFFCKNNSRLEPQIQEFSIVKENEHILPFLI